MISLIGVGDNTIDTYIHQGMRYPGGNAVNVAVLARREGASAAYLGWLGDDDNGQLLLSSLQQEGLDVSHVRVVAGPNGYSTVEVIDGDRVFGASDPGPCRQICLTPADYAYISRFDVVHTSVFSYLEKDMAALKQASRCLSFDFSDQLDPDYLETILPHVDVALFSGAALPLEDQPAFIAAAHTHGVRLVMITRGGQGAWVSDGQTTHHQGVVPTQVVDTLGAGDAFAARFLVEWAGETPIPTAMLRAAESAARNCTHYGAYGYGMPVG